MNQQDETQQESIEANAGGAQSTVPSSDARDYGDGIRYELRIGVTGHRELDDRAGAKTKVQGVIDEIVEVLAGASQDPHGKYGSKRTLIHWSDRFLASCLSLCTRLLCPIINAVLSAFNAPDRWLWPVVPVATIKPTLNQQTPLKLTAISNLAIGADQILIEVIDETLKGPARHGLVSADDRNRYVEAVLPFPEHIYEKKHSESDAKNFRKLLNLDRGKDESQTEPTVIFPEFPTDSSGKQLQDHEAYQAASEYMVNTSEMIIAIWDPNHAEDRGGTGKTARYALSRGKMVIWLNPKNPRQAATVLRPRTPQSEEHMKNSGDWELAAIDAPDGLLAYEFPKRAKPLSPNFHRLAAYNRDGAITEAEFNKKLDKRATDFDAKACGQLPKDVRDAIVQYILPRMVRADMLSVRYRDLRTVASWLWPTAAALAVSMIGFQIFFLPDQYWIAWIELLLLVICAISYRVSVYDAWHDKWRNDRRLAEGLRSVLHSSIVLSTDTPKNKVAYDAKNQPGVRNPLPFYSPEQSWLVGTIKRIVGKERSWFAGKIDWHRDLVGIQEFLAEHWILQQKRYHEGNAARHHWQAKKYKYLRLMIIALIVVVSIMHARGVGHAADHGTHDDHHPGAHFGRMDLWIALFTGVLPAWGAMIHALSTMDDHERFAERSDRMVELLSGLAERFKDAQTREELQTYVTEAERLFDLESQEWAESLADRKPEVNG